MTLTQLEAFVLVARLGSVRAAARALAVSEPAVSASLAALRRDLGDPLVVRSADGMTLTDGGRRLIGIASQMTHLAAQARAAVEGSGHTLQLVRMAASAIVCECVAPPLVEAFTARNAGVEISMSASRSRELAALLDERATDLVIGPRIARAAGSGLESEPVLRDRLLVVAAPSHPLARRSDLAEAALAGAAWVADPSGADPHSETGSLLRRLGVELSRVLVFPSHAAALNAVRDGAGIAVSLGHTVRHELHRRSLARVRVAGTPLEYVWHANTLTADRRSAACSALLAYLRSPDAVAAMHVAQAGVPAGRYRPAVYVTLWDSMSSHSRPMRR